MSIEYEAFISYRHAPLDMKIASRIHRQLENFKIPKSIQEVTGKKKISRIFRDKEELPVTSDLNDSIKRALDNSSFLIVVCSESLKESIWVQREIEYFLQNHSVDQVLTVLAEGEPNEIVPKILQYEKVETDEITGESKKVLLEPLSCDYRMNSKKAKTEELPRLVATILGCAYDDLRQRQKQRKKRILAGVLSVMFAFLLTMATFFAWIALEIKESYNNSLINQSEYLASESLKLYESGDKLTAMLLALEALPSEDNDRPLVAKAQYALETILQPYENSNSTGYEVTGMLRHSGLVSSYSENIVASQDEKYLAVENGNGSICVWNVESDEKIFEKNIYGSLLNVIFTKDESLVAVFPGKIICFDYLKDEILWEFTSEEEQLYFSQAYAVSQSESIIAISESEGIYLIDTKTSEIVNFIEAPVESSGLFKQEINCISFSPDGEKIAFVSDKNQLNIFSVSSEATSFFEGSFNEIKHIEFNSQNSVLICDASKGCMLGGMYGEGKRNYESYIEFVLINTDTLSQIWSNRLEFTGVYNDIFVKQMVYEKKEVLACASGNICIIIDKKNGEMLKKIQLTDTVMAMETLENKSIQFILSDGSIDQYNSVDEFVLNVSVFGENVEWAEYIGGKIYILSDCESTDLRAYEYTEYRSAEWNEIDAVAFSGSSMDSFVGEEFIVFYNGETDNKYFVIDKKSKIVIYNGELPEEYRENNNSFLNFSKDGKKLYFTTEIKEVDQYSSHYVIVEFNFETLKTTELKTFEDSYTQHITAVRDGYFYYYSTIDYETNQTTYELIYENIQELERVATEFTVDSTFFISDIIASECGEILLIEIGEGSSRTYSYKTFNINNGESLNCQDKFTFCTPVWNENGTLFAAYSQEYIYVYDNEFSRKCGIVRNNIDITAMYLTNSELFVAYEDKSICAYDIINGSFSGKVALSSNMEFDSRWDFSVEGILAVETYHNLTVIDLNSWSVKSEIPKCCAYSPGENTVYTYLSDEETGKDKIGYFEMLDAEKLVEKSILKLGNMTLNEQQKSEYGID